LDDCLLHTKTEDDLLATLNVFLKQYREHGLKLHASKCVLFSTTVRYCGRLITKDGERFHPKNMEALQTMQEPQNGADLVQYIAAVNWMRSAIPNYSKRVAPLQAALAKVFGGKSRRTKKAAAAVSLLQLWGPEEQAAFKDLQATIMESIPLAFPDPDKRICVLTDASYRFYAGLVTLIALFEGRKRLVANKHILEICRLTDNFRGGEDNRYRPSNLRLNVQNEMPNIVLQNTIFSLNKSRFVMSACILFAKSDIVATQHVLEVTMRKLLVNRHLSR
jgi:hypothetical protein